MKLSYLFTILITIFSFVTFFSINHNPESHTFHNDLIQEKEIRFSNLRQLTFSGENAEAYFSFETLWSPLVQIINSGAAKIQE